MRSVMPLPFLHVAPDALLALLDERLDAVGFDFFFRVDAELFADFDFDGQAVGVPAGFAFAEVAAHRAVAREEVFDGAGEAVAGVGHAVGGRRAFVEDEGGAPARGFERLVGRCRCSFQNRPTASSCSGKFTLPSTGLNILNHEDTKNTKCQFKAQTLLKIISTQSLN